MRKIFGLLSLLLACVWLAGCPGGGEFDPPDNTDPTAEKQTMLDRHNATRTSLGAGTLSINTRLNTIAQSHAEWMLSAGNLSHTDANGGSVGDRATAAGYTWMTVGENLARAGSGSTAYTLWLGSSGHYANITNPEFVDVGIGLAEAGGVQYWCVVFGAQ